MRAATCRYRHPLLPTRRETGFGFASRAGARSAKIEPVEPVRDINRGTWHFVMICHASRMRALRVFMLFVGLAGFPGSGSCDQTDPRLGALFEQLKAATQPTAASSIEHQIWEIWLEPPDPAIQALMDEGVDAMEQGDYGAALETFDQIVALAPNFAEAWNKRATVHYLLGDLQESLADIDATLKLEPHHFGALSGRGLVYVKLGEYQRALSAFEDALDVSPQSAGPLANVRALREILGQRDI
jgi:Tetratricopeptide repeat